MKIPFHRPTFDKSTISEIENVLESGWVTSGKRTLLFEEELSEYLNSKHVIGVNSYHSSSFGKSDFRFNEKRFFVPSYTFVSSIEIGEYIKAFH